MNPISQLTTQIDRLKIQFDSINRLHNKWDNGQLKYIALPQKTESALVLLAEEIAKLQMTRGILVAQRMNQV